MDFTYKYVSNNVTPLSTIDHFVARSAVYDAVQDAGVIHNGENTSNHSTIFFARVAIGELDYSLESQQIVASVNCTLASSMVKENYISSLKDSLAKIRIPDCVNYQDHNYPDH